MLSSQSFLPFRFAVYLELLHLGDSSIKAASSSVELVCLASSLQMFSSKSVFPYRFAVYLELLHLGDSSVKAASSSSFF